MAVQSPAPPLTPYPTVGAGQNTSSGSNQQYFQDPAMVQQLSQMLSGVGQQAGSQYMNFVSNPTASPLFTNQLSGLLQSLQPSEAASRTAMQDSGRAAGMMASGPFANATALNESNILRNRQTMASQLLGQIFPQMTQALQQPMSMSEQLINAMKMQQSSQASNSQQFGPQAANGGLTDPFGMLSNQPSGGIPGGGNGSGTPSSGGSGTTLSQLLQALSGGGSTGINNNATNGGNVNTQTQSDAYYGHGTQSSDNTIANAEPLTSTDYGYYNPGQTWE